MYVCYGIILKRSYIFSCMSIIFTIIDVFLFVFVFSTAILLHHFRIMLFPSAAGILIGFLQTVVNPSFVSMVSILITHVFLNA